MTIVVTSFSSDSQSGVEIHDVLDRALSQLKSIRESRTEPLAIIGMGCRFPGASSPEAFWELLAEGRCEIRDTPADRFNAAEYQATAPGQKGRITSCEGSYIDDVDQFDASFFNLSGREANLMDPQQRLLLEVAWETLENAGINPQSTKGSATGVYVGICSSDYLHLLTRHDPSDLDAWVSTGNAHGSAAGRLSYVFDWRGPCVAVDTACSSSLVALHLAVQALRNEECRSAFVAGVNLMLAPDLSISLSQAGMLSPDGRCKTFSEAANGFVRGEGCGGILLKRLSLALADGDTVLCVIRGSATNQDGRSIGLTAPNGLAQQAVIRAALANARLSPKHISSIEAHGTGTALGDPIEMSALQEVFAPGRSVKEPLYVGSVKTNLGHLEGGAGIAGVIKTALALSKQTLPPHLHLETPSTKIDWGWPVMVPQALAPWPSVNGQKRAAGVSSFGFGGSNAHIILEEVVADAAKPLGQNPRKGILKISAKTQPALKELAAAYRLRLNDEELESLCYTSCVGRADFSHRIAIPATTASRMKELLKEWLNGKTALADLYAGTSEDELRTCWVFPGRLNLDASFAWVLAERDALLQLEWDKANGALESFWPRNLGEILSQPAHRNLAEEAVATVALQWISGQLLLRWGLKPSRILGRGPGEISGACLAGHFSLSDALRLASDPTFADRMELSRALYPYHSIRRNAPSDSSVLTPGYWRKAALADPKDQPLESLGNLRGMLPLVFSDEQIPRGSDLEREPLTIFAASEEDPQGVWHLASRLYVLGATLDWTKVFPTPVKKTPLPTYPFQRRSHWFTTKRPSEVVAPKSHPLLASHAQRNGQPSPLEVDLNAIPYLRGHQIRDVSLCPLTFLLEMALAGAASRNHRSSTPLKVTDLTIARPVLWTPNAPCLLRATYHPNGNGVECRFQTAINGTWVESSHCRVSSANAPWESPPVLPEDGVEQSVEEHYQRFEQSGLTYKDEFQCVQSLVSHPQKNGQALAWGRIRLPEDTDTRGYFLHPALLDGCLQVTMTVLKDRPEDALMPVGVKEYRFYQSPGSREVVSIITRAEQDENRQVQIDLTIVDSTNSLVAEIKGLTLKEVTYHAETLLGLGRSRSSAVMDKRAESCPLDLSDRVSEFIKSRIAAILDLSAAELDLSQPLIDLGMDSIMAIELRNEILTEFQVELSMEELLEIRTPQDLMARLFERLEGQTLAQHDRTPRSDWVEGAI